MRLTTISLAILAVALVATPSPLSQQAPQPREMTLQEKSCDIQAKSLFEEYVLRPNAMDAYSSHLDSSGTCYAWVHSVLPTTNNQVDMDIIYDTAGPRPMAKYVWVTLWGRDRLATPPVACSVGDTPCRSLDEFRRLAAQRFGISLKFL